jgi:hypothetical protein
MQRFIIVLGLAILLAGVFRPWLSKLPLGGMPGDIVINRPGFKIYIPIATMLNKLHSRLSGLKSSP